MRARGAARATSVPTALACGAALLGAGCRATTGPDDARGSLAAEATGAVAGVRALVVEPYPHPDTARLVVRLLTRDSAAHAAWRPAAVRLRTDRGYDRVHRLTPSACLEVRPGPAGAGPQALTWLACDQVSAITRRVLTDDEVGALERMVVGHVVFRRPFRMDTRASYTFQVPVGRAATREAVRRLRARPEVETAWHADATPACVLADDRSPCPGWSLFAIPAYTYGAAGTDTLPGRAARGGAWGALACGALACRAATRRGSVGVQADAGVPSPALRTSDTVYAVRVTPDAYSVTIPVTYTNRTRDTVRIRGCSHVLFQRSDADSARWRHTYSPVCPAIAFTHTAVPPGAAHGMAFQMHVLRRPRVRPQFTGTLPGTYRLELGVYEAGRGVGGGAEGLRPAAERTSNAFRLTPEPCDGPDPRLHRHDGGAPRAAARAAVRAVAGAHAARRRGAHAARRRRGHVPGPRRGGRLPVTPPARAALPPPAVRVEAVARVAGQGPAVLEAEFTVTNPGRRAVVVSWSSCHNPAVLLHSADARSGPLGAAGTAPTWDSRRVRFRLPTGELVRPVCARRGGSVRPVPGASTRAAGARGRLEVRAAVPNVLGDSLPDGRYRVAARLELGVRDAVRDADGEDDRTMASERTHVAEVPAGVVHLARRQLPPPAERVVAGEHRYPVIAGAVGYRIVLDPPLPGGPVPRDWVTAPRLVVHNVGPGEARLYLSPCDPFRLALYRTPAEAGEPLGSPSDAPAWRGPALVGAPGPACDFAPTLVLGRRARVEIPRPPFLARDALGDSLPPGRYYLAADTPAGRVGVGALEIAPD